MASVTVTSENLAEFTANGGKMPPQVVEPVETKPDETPEAPPKKKHSVDERLAEMAAQRREAQKEASDLRKQIEDLKAASKPKGAEPQPGDFTDAVKYAEALADWRVEKKLAEREQEFARNAEEKEKARIATEWNKRFKQAAKEIEDFEEVIMAEPLTLQPEIVNAMYESELGPRLHYFFSSDREEAEKINAMSPRQALRHLGRIEAQIEAQMAGKNKPGTIVPEVPETPRRKVAAPPEPITPVNGRGSTSLGPVDDKGNVT
jgi:hypothetical protein